MYQRILVGSDGTKTAARAVDRAVEVARATGGRVTILCATSDVAAGERIVQAEAERHAGAGIGIETLVAQGDAASEILDVAEDGRYDLVVLGNKGMTGARRFLGSVPNKVSHHLACSLLIVRTT